MRTKNSSHHQNAMDNAMSNNSVDNNAIDSVSRDTAEVMAGRTLDPRPVLGGAPGMNTRLRLFKKTFTGVVVFLGVLVAPAAFGGINVLSDFRDEVDALENNDNSVLEPEPGTTAEFSDAKSAAIEAAANYKRVENEINAKRAEIQRLRNARDNEPREGYFNRRSSEAKAFDAEVQNLKKQVKSKEAELKRLEGVYNKTKTKYMIAKTKNPPPPSAGRTARRNSVGSQSQNYGPSGASPRRGPPPAYSDSPRSRGQANGHNGHEEADGEDPALPVGAQLSQTITNLKNFRANSAINAKDKQIYDQLIQAGERAFQIMRTVQFDPNRQVVSTPAYRAAFDAAKSVNDAYVALLSDSREEFNRAFRTANNLSQKMMAYGDANRALQLSPSRLLGANCPPSPSGLLEGGSSAVSNLAGNTLPVLQHLWSKMQDGSATLAEKQQFGHVMAQMSQSASGPLASLMGGDGLAGGDEEDGLSFDDDDRHMSSQHARGAGGLHPFPMSSRDDSHTLMVDGQPATILPELNLLRTKVKVKLADGSSEFLPIEEVLKNLEAASHKPGYNGNVKIVSLDKDNGHVHLRIGGKDHYVDSYKEAIKLYARNQGASYELPRDPSAQIAKVSSTHVTTADGSSVSYADYLTNLSKMPHAPGGREIQIRSVFPNGNVSFALPGGKPQTKPMAEVMKMLSDRFGGGVSSGPSASSSGAGSVSVNAVNPFGPTPLNVTTSGFLQKHVWIKTGPGYNDGSWMDVSLFNNELKKHYGGDLAPQLSPTAGLPNRAGRDSNTSWDRYYTFEEPILNPDGMPSGKTREVLVQQDEISNFMQKRYNEIKERETAKAAGKMYYPGPLEVVDTGVSQASSGQAIKLSDGSWYKVGDHKSLDKLIQEHFGNEIRIKSVTRSLGKNSIEVEKRNPDGSIQGTITVKIDGLNALLREAHERKMAQARAAAKTSLAAAGAPAPAAGSVGALPPSKLASGLASAPVAGGSMPPLVPMAPLGSSNPVIAPGGAPVGSPVGTSAKTSAAPAVTASSTGAGTGAAPAGSAAGLKAQYEAIGKSKAGLSAADLLLEYRNAQVANVNNGFTHPTFPNSNNDDVVKATLESLKRDPEALGKYLYTHPAKAAGAAPAIPAPPATATLTPTAPSSITVGNGVIRIGRGKDGLHKVTFPGGGGAEMTESGVKSLQQQLEAEVPNAKLGKVEFDTHAHEIRIEYLGTTKSTNKTVILGKDGDNYTPKKIEYGTAPHTPGKPLVAMEKVGSNVFTVKIEGINPGKSPGIGPGKGSYNTRSVNLSFDEAETVLNYIQNGFSTAYVNKNQDKIDLRDPKMGGKGNIQFEKSVDGSFSVASAKLFPSGSLTFEATTKSFKIQDSTKSTTETRTFNDPKTINSLVKLLHGKSLRELKVDAAGDTIDIVDSNGIGSKFVLDTTGANHVYRLQGRNPGPVTVAVEGGKVVVKHKADISDLGNLSQKAQDSLVDHFRGKTVTGLVKDKNQGLSYLDDQNVRHYLKLNSTKDGYEHEAELAGLPVGSMYVKMDKDGAVKIKNSVPGSIEKTLSLKPVEAESLLKLLHNPESKIKTVELDATNPKKVIFSDDHGMVTELVPSNGKYVVEKHVFELLPEDTKHNKVKIEIDNAGKLAVQPPTGVPITPSWNLSVANPGQITEIIKQLGSLKIKNVTQDRRKKQLIFTDHLGGTHTYQEEGGLLALQEWKHPAYTPPGSGGAHTPAITLDNAKNEAKLTGSGAPVTIPFADAKAMKEFRKNFKGMNLTDITQDPSSKDITLTDSRTGKHVLRIDPTTKKYSYIGGEIQSAKGVKVQLSNGKTILAGSGASHDLGNLSKKSRISLLSYLNDKEINNLKRNGNDLTFEDEHGLKHTLTPNGDEYKHKSELTGLPSSTYVKMAEDGKVSIRPSVGPITELALTPAGAQSLLKLFHAPGSTVKDIRLGGGDGKTVIVSDTLGMESHFEPQMDGTYKSKRTLRIDGETAAKNVQIEMAKNGAVSVTQGTAPAVPTGWKVSDPKELVEIAKQLRGLKLSAIKNGGGGAFDASDSAISFTDDLKGEHKFEYKAGSLALQEWKHPTYTPPGGGGAHTPAITLDNTKNEAKLTGSGGEINIGFADAKAMKEFRKNFKGMNLTDITQDRSNNNIILTDSRTGKHVLKQDPMTGKYSYAGGETQSGKKVEVKLSGTSTVISGGGSSLTLDLNKKSRISLLSYLHNKEVNDLNGDKQKLSFSDEHGLKHTLTLNGDEYKHTAELTGLPPNTHVALAENGKVSIRTPKGNKELHLTPVGAESLLKLFHAPGSRLKEIKMGTDGKTVIVSDALGMESHFEPKGDGTYKSKRTLRIDGETAAKNVQIEMAENGAVSVTQGTAPAVPTGWKVSDPKELVEIAKQLRGLKLSAIKNGGGGAFDASDSAISFTDDLKGEHKFKYTAATTSLVLEESKHPMPDGSAHHPTIALDSKTNKVKLTGSTGSIDVAFDNAKDMKKFSNHFRGRKLVDIKGVAGDDLTLTDTNGVEHVLRYDTFKSKYSYAESKRPATNIKMEVFPGGKTKISANGKAPIELSKLSRASRDSLMGYLHDKTVEEITASNDGKDISFKDHMGIQHKLVKTDNGLFHLAEVSQGKNKIQFEQDGKVTVSGTKGTQLGFHGLSETGKRALLSEFQSKKIASVDFKDKDTIHFNDENGLKRTFKLNSGSKDRFDFAGVEFKPANSGQVLVQVDSAGKIEFKNQNGKKLATSIATTHIDAQNSLFNSLSGRQIDELEVTKSGTDHFVTFKDNYGITRKLKRDSGDSKNPFILHEIESKFNEGKTTIKIDDTGKIILTGSGIKTNVPITGLSPKARESLISHLHGQDLESLGTYAGDEVRFKDKSGVQTILERDGDRFLMKQVVLTNADRKRGGNATLKIEPDGALTIVDSNDIFKPLKGWDSHAREELLNHFQNLEVNKIEVHGDQITLTNPTGGTQKISLQKNKMSILPPEENSHAFSSHSAARVLKYSRGGFQYAIRPDEAGKRNTTIYMTNKLSTKKDLNVDKVPFVHLFKQDAERVIGYIGDGYDIKSVDKDGNITFTKGSVVGTPVKVKDKDQRLNLCRAFAYIGDNCK